MRSFLVKLVLVIAAVAAIRSQVSGPGLTLFKGRDLGKLWPLKVDYAQGPAFQEGKPVLLEFWATWCGPCVASMPHIADIAQRYNGRGLQVIGVTDDSSKNIGDFLRQHQIVFPIAIDHSQQYFRALDIRGIPHSVLVDKTGHILWEGHPSELTEAILEAALR